MLADLVDATSPSRLVKIRMQDATGTSRLQSPSLLLESGKQDSLRADLGCWTSLGLVQDNGAWLQEFSI